MPRDPFSDYAAMPWMAQAVCADRNVDADTFFPPPGRRMSAPALLMCNECPVKSDCLQLALTLPWAVEGIWGGTTEGQRRRMRQRRPGRVYL